VKKLLIWAIILLAGAATTQAQCPQVYDSQNNLSSNPYWISCTGNNYVLNFESNSSWAAFSIDWGDGSPLHNDVSYTANAIISHTYTATVDTFIVTLTIPSQNCTLTGVVVMEQAVNAAIMLPVNVSTIACVSTLFKLINGSNNNSQTTKYEWDFGDGSPVLNFNYLNQAAIVNHTYLPNQTTCTRFVTLKAWNYCSFTNTSVATLTVSVFEKDQAAISTSTSIKCWPNGSVYTFSATSSQNCTSSGNNFQRERKWFLGNVWSYNNFNDSIIDWTPFPPVTTVSVSFPNSGTFPVVLYDSSYCGVSTATINVNIFNAPTASIVPPPLPHCVATPLTFTNASTAGSFYKWDFGEGPGFATQPAGPFSYSYTAPGTYTVKHVAFLPFDLSCHDTDAVVITIVPTPTAAFAHSPLIGCDAIVNATFTDQSLSAVAWDWDFGNIVTSTLQAPPPQTYGNVGTHTIHLMVTAANGCTSVAQSTVEVYPSPAASFIPPTVCLNAVSQFTDQSVTTPTMPALTYTWSFGDASSPSFLQNPSHIYSSSGNFTVTLTVNNSQCSNTYTDAVTVHPNPTVSFAHTPTVGCTPLLSNFTNASIGANSFSWNFGDLSATSSATNTTHSFTNTSSSNVIYTITLTGTNIFGCKDSLKRQALVYPLPLVNAAISPTAGCSPLAVSFTNTGSGFTSSNWTFGNSLSSTSLTTSTTYTNNPGDAAQTFTVKLVSTSSNACKDSSNYLVILHPQPIAAFNFSTSVCAPKTVSFTNQSIGATSYTWDFGGESTSTGTNVSHFFTNTTAVPQTSVISLQAANIQGCVFTSTQTLLVFPKPDINVVPNIDSGCTRLRVIFPAITGITSYSWNFDNGNSASTPSAVVFFDNPTHLIKIYNVRLIGADANGCLDTAFKTIKVFPKPNAGFEVTADELFLPDAVITPSNISTGASTYTWSFGDGGSSSSQNPSYTYKNKGEYTIRLIARSNNGCRDTFILGKTIIVLDDSFFAIPNAFTPNTAGSPGNVFNPNDLSNDIFYPRLKGVVKYRFTIFSRWGEVMYDTDKVTEGWDGYYKGNLSNADVYIWKIYMELANGQVMSKTGDVTLIR